MNVIQMGFDPQDDKLWYLDPFLWDDDTVENTARPTERAAFRRLFRQGRLLSKRGVFINLSPLHIQVMRMEQSALISEPVPDNVYNWISSRMHGFPPLQIKAILDECSLVVLLRDALHMAPIAVDWPVREGVGKRAA